MVWKAQTAVMTTAELERKLATATPCFSILVYYMVNSSLVFKQSSGCFLGVRKAQLLHVKLLPFACSVFKSVVSAMRRTCQCCPCVSLKSLVQRLWHISGNTRGLWTFRDFGSISNPYLFTYSGAEMLMSSSSDTGHSLAIGQVTSALSVPPPVKQDIKHPKNVRNKILTDI